MRATSLIIAVPLLISGCATGTAETVHRGTPTTTTIQTIDGDLSLEMTPETFTSSDWVRAPRDQVWAALPQVYGELEISPLTIDPEEGIFGNRDVRVSRIAGERLSRFLDCGTNPIGAPVANTATVQLQIITQLKGVGDGTDVATTVVARARPRTGSATNVQCASTGELEALIARRLTELTTSES